jgi:hypothetical protein
MMAHFYFQVLKWNFTIPTEDHVDLLKEQMLVANVNKTLMASMFHSDFKRHLKAVDALSEVRKILSKKVKCGCAYLNYLKEGNHPIRARKYVIV